MHSFFLTSSTVINGTKEVMVTTSMLPYPFNYIVFILLLFLAVIAAGTLIVLVYRNGITVKDKVVIKGVRKESTDFHSELFRYVFINDRTKEIRNGFITTMVNHIRNIRIFDDDTCEEHLKHLELLVVEQLFDFINDNHVIKKANFNSKETRRLLTTMNKDVKTKWESRHKKDCLGINKLYSQYKDIVFMQISSFYEEFQRETVKMIDRTLDVLTQENFETDSAKKRMSEEIEYLTAMKKKIRDSYIDSSKLKDYKYSDDENLDD